jgi:hypothetical protein
MALLPYAYRWWRRCTGHAPPASTDTAPRPKLFGSSGFWAFWICAAVAGVGYLMARFLWSAGGWALVVLGVFGMVTFEYSRDWRHPWRSV